MPISQNWWEIDLIDLISILYYKFIRCRYTDFGKTLVKTF